MIANLPLLFASGLPTSLASIKIPELERFITFMVQCSLGHDTVRVVKKPAWWPREVEFSNPFRRPAVVPQNWGGLLRQLVRQCYKYHDCTFLLSFSAKLAKHARSKLKFVDNRDRTTSIYDEPSGRLLVTFRNENLLYDQVHKRRLLNKPLKTTQLRPSDIYLCDYCDSHFDSYVGLQTHERLCGPAPVPTEPTQTVLPVSPEGTLENFVNALGLQHVQNTNSTTYVGSSHQKIPSRQIRISSALNFTASLPFSSLAGRKYSRPQHKYNHDVSSFDRVERYCSALPLDHEQPRWLNRRPAQQIFALRFRRPEGYWNRQYKFPLDRDKPALDLKSQILYLQCKSLSVSLERLPIDVFRKYEKMWKDNRKKLKAMSTAKRKLFDEDVEFISETVIEDVPLQVSSKSIIANSDDVIDLCSDDEDSIGNENTDPKAAFICYTKNGLQQSGHTAKQSSEPCGTTKNHNIVPVIREAITHMSTTQPFNSIQVISIE